MGEGVKEGMGERGYLFERRRYYFSLLKKMREVGKREKKREKERERGKGREKRTILERERRKGRGTSLLHRDHSAEDGTGTHPPGVVYSLPKSKVRQCLELKI